MSVGQFSIIVPVFDAPASVDALLTTLAANTEPSLVSEILIGDDASDLVTVELLKRHAELNPKLQILRRDRNLGFLQNVNDLYRRARVDQIVLLNSDTMVPPRWLPRISAGLNRDPTVALATPLSTNVENLTLQPSQGQSWRDLDLVLSRMPPRYPDAPSAVGFALAINRSLIDRAELLDPAYREGYWEDTDLHFYVKSRGLGSVIVDNLLIFHERGNPSFSVVTDVPDVYVRSKRIFDMSWGSEYIGAASRFERERPLDHIRDEQHRFRFALQSDIRVLFVLPQFTRGFGGIDVVVRLAERLVASGVSAAILSRGLVDWKYVWQRGTLCPYLSLDEVVRSGRRVSAVVATYHDTLSTAQALGGHFDAEVFYLVQGPETAFEPSRSETIADGYRTAACLVVSEFLARYVEAVSGVESTRIRVGPSPLVFSPSTRIKRDPLAVAVCARRAHLKGTGDAFTNALTAHRAGFRIHVFGDADAGFEHAERHGELTQDGVARLFQSVGFYLDCSHMEGLGLLPLEAAFCGAVPIVADLRGLQGLLEDKKNCLVLPAQYSNGNFFRLLYQRVEAGAIEPIRAAATELRGDVNENLAFEDFLKALCVSPVEASAETAGRIVPARWIEVSALEEARLIRRAERLRASLSFRIGHPWRVAAAALTGRELMSPEAPTTAGQAIELIKAVKASRSWRATVPVRAVRRWLRPQTRNKDDPDRNVTTTPA